MRRVRLLMFLARRILFLPEVVIFTGVKGDKLRLKMDADSETVVEGCVKMMEAYRKTGDVSRQRRRRMFRGQGD